MSELTEGWLQELFFVSGEHRGRFAARMQQLGKVWENGRFDPEYVAAFYILAADAGTWKKASEHMSRIGIDFEALLDQVGFSSGDTVLVKLAANLFNGGEHIEPVDFLGLDEANFRLALMAVQLRRYGLRLDKVREG